MRVYKSPPSQKPEGSQKGVRVNVGDTSHLPASDGPLKRCACCKVFGHVQDECQKNIGSGVAKNLKKHSQAPRGVPLGLKVGFKPAKQVYRPVSKKHNANTSGNKKKDVEPKKEVSNLILFKVLNSVKNDVDLGTNRGTSNLASKKANSSGSSFWNVRSSSTSTTLLACKNDKMIKTYIDKKSYTVNDKVKLEESVLASKKVGYCTNSLLEQWKETYEIADYDYDPYDDNM
ncbi:hypothetical protein Tco_0195008 [Tanacetum coccineum]